MKKLFVLLVSACLLICGCGRMGNRDADRNREESTGQEQEAPADREGMTAEEPPTEDSSEEETLFVKEVRTVQFAAADTGYIEYNTCYDINGSKICMLRAERAEESDTGRIFVQIYDAVTGNLEQYPLQIPDPYGDSYILSSDFTAGGEVSLKLQSGEDNEGVLLMKMNLEGEILEVRDPFPEPEDYPWNPDAMLGVRVFDLADGRTVLSRYQQKEQCSVLTWFEAQTGEERPLGKLEQAYLTGLTADGEGMIYYLAGDSLMRWDAEKDVSQELFHLHENGIAPYLGSSGITVDGQGNILLCLMQEEQLAVYVLTDEMPANRDKIRLSCMAGTAGIYYIQRCANMFPRNGGGVFIDVESVKDSDQEDYRNRILAELTAGKGPELMWVSESDMIMLQEKGLLCDLSQLIPEDIQKELIPGVKELGTVNGELVGLVPEASFSTMVTGNQTWEKEGWTPDEFIALMDTREDWDWPVSFLSTRMNASTLLYLVFIRDLEHSSLLDLEQGVSHFDSEEFIHILELCQKYGQTDSEERDGDERLKMLEQGETLAEIEYFYGGLDWYSDMMRRYEKNCHVVGFPTESGSGNYVNSYSFGYLVVNAQAEHKEEIGEYFTMLLDYSNQFKVVGCSVRMDVIRDSVVYNEYEGKEVMRRSADTDEYVRLTLKPDGSTYLEEFLEFVESCEPEPRIPTQIMGIMGGELGPCFEGRKSARETAELIHRGVQLYLDETADH